MSRSTVLGIVSLGAVGSLSRGINFILSDLATCNDFMLSLCSGNTLTLVFNIGEIPNISWHGLKPFFSSGIHSIDRQSQYIFQPHIFIIGSNSATDME